jgi:hypothetical protein
MDLSYIKDGIICPWTMEETHAWCPDRREEEERKRSRLLSMGGRIAFVDTVKVLCNSLRNMKLLYGGQVWRLFPVHVEEVIGEWEVVLCHWGVGEFQTDVRGFCWRTVCWKEVPGVFEEG